MLDPAADARGQLMHERPADLFEFIVRRADPHPLQVVAKRSLRVADAHAVVVEDDQQLPIERAGVVQAFECDTVDDRRIADDRDDVILLAGQLIPARHADGGGNRGSRVADGEKVVRRFIRDSEIR